MSDQPAAGHPVIDTHAHVFLPAVIGQMGDAGPEVGIRDGQPFFRSGGYLQPGARPLDSPLTKVDARLELMDKCGIDLQIISPNALTFFYRQPAGHAADFARFHNDALAEYVSASPRLYALGALPLQDTDASVAELHRMTGELGFVGSFVGTDAGDRLLLDPALAPVWAAHEALGVPVMIHASPRSVESAAEPGRALLDVEEVYGFIADEAIAVAHLVLGGVLDRHPALRVHVSHGGGFAPYQQHRLELGITRRAALKGVLQRPFADVWAQLSFDTAIHGQEAIEFLVTSQRPDRVLLGCNFAGWDNATDSIDTVSKLDIDDTRKHLILGGNARDLFRIPAPGKGASK
jgi:aminocarboxymuconate-semialdehyde decarboxylase